MDDPSSLRNTKGIHARISKIRKDLVSHFESVLTAASTTRLTDDETRVDDTDRASTAVAQHQIQVSTAALIKSAEDLQTLIRQLQEIWLFGQLNTLGDSAAKEQADADAKAVAQLLTEVLGQQGKSSAESRHTLAPQGGESTQSATASQGAAPGAAS